MKHLILARERALRNAESQAKFDHEFLKRALKVPIGYSEDFWKGNSGRLELDEVIPRSSALEISGLLEARSLSSVLLVQYYITRIKNIDEGVFNSVIEINPMALLDAQRLDEERASGMTRSRLHGLTVLLKDNISALDMTTTLGAAVFDKSTSIKDAFLVEDLRKLGLIILGKTNLSELCGFTTPHLINGYSVLGGHTRNPYGLFDVGGSSSGSAAAVSMNLTNFAIGTETSGSLIYPSGQNSVVSLKPTLGLISRGGIIGISSAQGTPGPIAKNIRDLMTLFGSIITHDPDDELSKSLFCRETSFHLETDYLKGKRIGIAKPFGSDDICNINALRAITQSGAILVEFDWRYSQKMNNMVVTSYEMRNNFPKQLNAIDTKVSSLEDIVSFNNHDRSKRCPFGQESLEAVLKNSIDTDLYYSVTEENRKISRCLIDKCLSSHDIEFFVFIGHQISYSYDVAGYPALTVPIGYRSTGEPYALTLVGPSMSDFTLLKAAYAIEQTYPVRRDPF